MISYECGVVKRESQKVVSIKFKSSAENLPTELGKVYGKIANYLQDKNICIAGAPFAAYFNMDESNLEVEAGFPVSEIVEGHEDIEMGEISECKFAKTIHTGSYNAMELAYNTLLEWMEEEKLDPVGIAYEFYLNDPSTTESEELQTEILFPLK